MPVVKLRARFVKILLLIKIKSRSANCEGKIKRRLKRWFKIRNSLAHTKWNCKYHIVFAPKYRRKIIYGELKKEIGKILRELCEWKQIEILETELCPEHIQVRIPPKTSVAGFVGYLKGKSSLLIHERYRNLKYKYGNRSFWV